VAALLVCPENYRVNAESVELLYQECQNLTNTPTLFRGLYIDNSLQRRIVLHLLLAGLEMPVDRLQGIRTKLQELEPEIVNRLNRRVSTNLGDDLAEWDQSNPLPMARRRSFGGQKPTPPVQPVLTDVKSAANLAEKRLAPSSHGGDQNAVKANNTSETAAAKEEEYKVLTVGQIADLMNNAKNLPEEDDKNKKGFWNQFKSIKKS